MTLKNKNTFQKNVCEKANEDEIHWLFVMAKKMWNMFDT